MAIYDFTRKPPWARNQPSTPVGNGLIFNQSNPVDTYNVTRQRFFPTGSNKLPYQELIDQNIGTINSLIGEVGTSTAPQRDLDMARNLSRQGSYARGIDGPLAVALEGDSQGRVIDAFQRQRLGNLAMLLNLSNQISSGQQSVQIQQRWQEYLRRLQEAQAEADNQTAWMTGLGTLLGGGAGFFIGGPTGIIPGAQIGGGAGGALSSLF